MKLYAYYAVVRIYYIELHRADRCRLESLRRKLLLCMEADYFNRFRE